MIMKPTDDDEKIASLKRKTLPAFALAALIFMVTIVSMSALLWFKIVPIFRRGLKADWRHVQIGERGMSG
jgi:hypothetical protein